MLKKVIKYEDYNGVEREEPFYFNLSKAEMLEMQMSINGGFEEMINQIIAEQDSAKIMEIFKQIILKAYGKKDLDGRRFIKSEELSKEFTETEAYSELIMELATDADKAADFIKGIMPKIETPAEQQKKAVPMPSHK